MKGRRRAVFTVTLFLAVILSVNTLYARNGEQLPPGNWETLRNGPFTVYFEEPDRSAAENLVSLYTNELQQFALKLKLNIPDKIRIFIAPNDGRFRYLTRGLPEWTGGVVFPSQRVVVLKSPRKLPGEGQFQATALHEGVHLLTEIGGKSHLPRWLSEGLAVYLSGETMFKNRIPLARAVVLKKTYTLDEIDDILQLGPEQARVAYLQSIDIVDFLVKRYGWDFVADLVAAYRNGKDADSVSEAVTGKPFYDVEVAWHQDLRKRYRWWMLVEWFNFDTLLWGSATLLVLVAGGYTIYRRKRYFKEPEPGIGENGFDWDAPFWDGDSTGKNWDYDEKP